MIPNHYGYGVRKDEAPYANKILPGCNWRSLPSADQLSYWNGRLPKSGGNTNGLRRRAWSEPAGTITTTPFQKLSCQLHPGFLASEKVTLPRPKPLLDFLPRMNVQQYRVVSLFSGGGLLDIGLIRAGLEVIWAAEIDLAAATAYRLNVGDHLIGPTNLIEARQKLKGNLEIIAPEDVPDCDIIVGGPPCQDFSVAGTGAGDSGERGRLVWKYLDVIQAKRPRLFLMENVKGLTTAKHFPTLLQLVASFEALGYSTCWKVLNAWDYGVAQKRERLIIVGTRRAGSVESPAYLKIAESMRTAAESIRHAHDDKSRKALLREGQELFEELHSLHFADGTAFRWPTSEFETSGFRPTLYDAIGDLPEPLATPGGNDGTYANHVPKEISPQALEGYSRRGGSGAFGLRTNSWEEPSPTIFGRIFNEGKAFIHPGFQDVTNAKPPRRFTVRECLRIQSVPDSYVFPESMSMAAMYKITGNGVPSRLGYHLGIAMITHLRKLDEYNKGSDWNAA